MTCWSPTGSHCHLETWTAGQQFPARTRSDTKNHKNTHCVWFTVTVNALVVFRVKRLRGAHVYSTAYACADGSGTQAAMTNNLQPHSDLVEFCTFEFEGCDQSHAGFHIRAASRMLIHRHTQRPDAKSKGSGPCTVASGGAVRVLKCMAVATWSSACAALMHVDAVAWPMPMWALQGIMPALLTLLFLSL